MEYLYSNMAVAAFIYVLGVASPGPSNLAIAQLSISSGRKAGLWFASGVIAGSFFWGLIVASGLGPLLESYAGVLRLLKIAGGLYFIFLAYTSFKNFRGNTQLAQNDRALTTEHYPRLFLSGTLFHLLNPKALVVWAAIIVVALPADAKAISLYVPVVICLPLGVLIFFGYALVFSNPVVVELCLRQKKWIDAFVGTVFGVVGLKLLLSTGDVK